MILNMLTFPPQSDCKFLEAQVHVLYLICTPHMVARVTNVEIPSKYSINACQLINFAYSFAALISRIFQNVSEIQKQKVDILPILCI